MIDNAVMCYLVELEAFIAEHPHLGAGRGLYRYGVTLDSMRHLGHRRSVRRALERFKAVGTVRRTGDRWRIADQGAAVAYTSDRSSSPA